MKKNILKKFILILITMLFLCSCTKKDEQNNENDSLKIETQNESEESQDTDSDMASGATASDEVENDIVEGKKKIYFANENADGYKSAEIESEVTPELVMQLLKDKNMVSREIQVIGCEITEIDNKKTIELDLSVNILDELGSKGTTGETMEMGSICNTFLSAFGCEQIQITAEGQALVTEHADYSGYMTAY